MHSVRIMLNHEVRTHRSADDFPITEHLAYKIQAAQGGISFVG